MTDTDERMIREIARLCSLPESRVERTVTLLQGGATIPFITRYRKEATGGLDEVQVGAVRDQLERLNALEARKRTVRSAIEAACLMRKRGCTMFLLVSTPQKSLAFFHLMMRRYYVLCQKMKRATCLHIAIIIQFP